MAARRYSYNVSVEIPGHIVKGSPLLPGNSLGDTWLACISLISMEGVMVMKRASMTVIAILTLCILIFSAGQSCAQSSRALFDVKIPMRDGTALSADIWLPSTEGRYPAVLIRTPYVKNLFHTIVRLGPVFSRKGYAMIIQDTRGRGDSDGEFLFFQNEGADGYDTIEWIAQQNWCDGKVGMMGVSYLATVQWLAAREHPPHLVCIVPTAPAGQYFQEVPYKGGGFMLEWALGWYNTTSARMSQTGIVQSDFDAVYSKRPLLTLDEALGRKMGNYRDALSHPTIDEYWKKIIFSSDDFEKLDIPALTVTGWFDDDQPGALHYWKGMCELSPARDRQYLRIGPWTHDQTFLGGKNAVGELSFGDESIIDNLELHFGFFNWYLKGIKPAEFPRIALYATGSNRWLYFNEYPPSESHGSSLYLHSGGKANTLLGDGRLSWTPAGREKPDRYVYNPREPVNVKMDQCAKDCRITEIRDDMLVYTGEILKSPLTIIGSVSLELYASSDAEDTDFMARLLDVDPDGKAVNLGCEVFSIIRARYRNGFYREVLLSPDKVEKYSINLNDFGHTFLAGHRIRLEITSSAFPFCNPNQNTGNPVATDTEWKIAHQKVFHDSLRPSRIILPVVDITLNTACLTGNR